MFSGYWVSNGLREYINIVCALSRSPQLLLYRYFHNAKIPEEHYSCFFVSLKTVFIRFLAHHFIFQLMSVIREEIKMLQSFF